MSPPPRQQHSFSCINDRGYIGLRDNSPPDSPRQALASISCPPLPAPALPPGKPIPPPIDPGVFCCVATIRRLIDEATELAPVGPRPIAGHESLGDTGGGRNVAISAMWIRHLRTLAVQKLYYLQGGRDSLECETPALPPGLSDGDNDNDDDTSNAHNASTVVVERAADAFLLAKALRSGAHGTPPPPRQLQTHRAPTAFLRATVIDGLEGYPVFLPPRSMAQAEFVETFDAHGYGHGHGHANGKLAIGTPPLPPMETHILMPRTFFDPLAPSTSSSDLSSGSGSSSALVIPGLGLEVEPETSPGFDLVESLDCARIILAPLVEWQRALAEQSALKKLSSRSVFALEFAHLCRWLWSRERLKREYEEETPADYYTAAWTAHRDCAGVDGGARERVGKVGWVDLEAPQVLDGESGTLQSLRDALKNRPIRTAGHESRLWVAIFFYLTRFAPALQVASGHSPSLMIGMANAIAFVRNS
ncbi:hypothetical protein EI94DRAFT_1794269 [Lactarius quietus]|nr:hypothetical protein EI94DRAFT_1794269 [Lactarius quietus]